MSHALTIDTLAFSKKLREAGADERLADAIVEGITAADTSELATKSDLREVETALRTDLREVETALRTDLREAETALRTDLRDLKTELKNDIVTLDHKIDTLRADTRADIAQSENRIVDTLTKRMGFLAAAVGILTIGSHFWH
jgi:DNA repair exonuclease SbcCD ATPase subunit